MKFEYNGIVVTAATKAEAVSKIKAAAKGKTDKQEKFEAELGEQLVKLGFKKSGKNTYKKGDNALNISTKDNGGEYFVYLKIDGKNGLVGTFDDAAEAAELLASTKWKSADAKPRTTNGSKKEAKDCGKDEKKGKKARACKGSRKAHASANDNWAGVPGIRFIWHGGWNDPEIEYKGMLMNVHDVEDALWDIFNDDVREGYFDKGDMDDHDAFDKWMEGHLDDAYEYAENICRAQLEDKATLTIVFDSGFGTSTCMGVELPDVDDFETEKEYDEAVEKVFAQVEPKFKAAGITNVYISNNGYFATQAYTIAEVELTGSLEAILNVAHGIDDSEVAKYELEVGSMENSCYSKRELYGYEYMFGNQATAGAKKLPRKATAASGLVPDELYEKWGTEYCAEMGEPQTPESMEMFNEFMTGSEPIEIVQRTFNGYDDYRGDGEGRGPFNPNHDYFYVNGHGNVVSLPAESLVERLKHLIDEDDFAEWLRGEGYLEGTPDSV